jgi:hypothetical protein
MENGSVSRRWWASERHNHERPSPSFLESQEENDWTWADETWRIDISGGCKAIQGGWESCSNLVGGKSKYFSGERKFDQSHRYRRRRWYRRKRVIHRELNGIDQTFSTEGFQLRRQKGVDLKSIAFHQPVLDLDARRRNAKQNDPSQKNQSDSKSNNFLDVATELVNEDSLKIYLKIRDGSWSKPALIPTNGAGHGIVKVYSSRWPAITKKMSHRKSRRKGAEIVSNSLAAGTEGSSKVKFSSGCLSPSCYELSYQVSVIEGQWGEFSRLLLLYPRFILRNDSDLWHLDVKQVGTPDSTLIHVQPKALIPFYWADANLPELICVRPVRVDSCGNVMRSHRWSGGLDLCDLGMIPLRIREEEVKMSTQEDCMFQKPVGDTIKVIRSLIEIRSGTGGTGITVSFKEESSKGEDSLYRIENHSPFPLWIAQDGVLANPQYDKGFINTKDMDFNKPSQCHGDLLSPNEKISFGLDVPFRQGKYAGRRASSLEELLTIRVALAPLSLRDGIETMKVIGLSFLGSRERLKPSNLRSFLSEDLLSEMTNVRVQGIVCADGPTRVLKFM